MILNKYRPVLKFKQRHITAAELNVVTESGTMGGAVRTKEGWEIPWGLAFVICYTRGKQKSCLLC